MKYEDKNINVDKTKPGKKNVPDLYPINRKVNENVSTVSKLDVQSNKLSKLTSNDKKQDNDEVQYPESNNVQMETDVEDFHPLKYCSISMEDTKETNTTILLPKQKRYNIIPSNVVTKKKYPCSFCSKVFGWSTDLKRHVLTHTGERPFKCKLCDASFTRNFLLQKHENKTHQTVNDWTPIVKNKVRMPSLKPIFTKAKAKDSHKQNKQKIKRKCLYKPENKLKSEFRGILRGQQNVIDTETIVQ